MSYAKSLKNPAMVCFQSTPRDVNGNLIWNGKNCYCTLSTGVNENNLVESSDISVYPNPSNGLINIEMFTDAENITVLNSLGQIIQTKTVKGETLVSLELEASGVYFIRVETSKKQVITKKLVVYK